MHGDSPKDSNGPALPEMKDMAEDILFQSEKAGLIDFSERKRRCRELETLQSPGEIDRIIRDLRPGGEPSGGRAPADTSRSSRRSSGRRGTDDTEEQQVITVFGETTRRGGWLEDSRLRVYNILGETHLDLTEEDLPDETGEPIEIELTNALGEIKITVPEDMIVQSQVTPILGEAKIHPDLRGRDDGISPLLRIRGTVVLGELSVRPPKN